VTQSEVRSAWLRGGIDVIEVQILKSEDLPRPKENERLTIRVRLAVNRNRWFAWCLVLSAEYEQPVEGFSAKQSYVNGPNPFRLSASALPHMHPGPYPIGRIPSLSEEMESTISAGYSLWAIFPEDGVDVEFELRRSS
jgi:hypothetical protein